jgi:protein-S-isoprenylcysteine O-methyltransferase Ste14
MLRLPVNIVAITVWCYWLSVVVMILRSHLRLKSAAGAVPKTGLERWMWLIWVPTVIGWQVFPRLAYQTSIPLLAASQWSTNHPSAILDWLAVVAAILAYVFTVPCWLTLGTNWSLAVVPEKQASLITRGFYAQVRHPIYSLGLVLMAATIAVAPSPAMLLVGIAHLVMVFLKSANEERFLERLHGQVYREYRRRTSRFFPWPGRMGTASASRVA